MKSRFMRNAVFALVAILFTYSTAFAYGPSIHMREADSYLLSCRTDPLPGPEHNPQLLERHLPYLRLGAIWPDIARVIVGLLDDAKVDEGLVDPHNRHFNEHLLALALDDYPEAQWQVAFAMGNLIHNAGDLVSQCMLTQHLAVLGHTGEMDVFVGQYDDHPGGEVEMLVEGGLEFTQPAFHLYNYLANFFLLTQQGREGLMQVLHLYLNEYRDYFGIDVPIGIDEAYDAVVEELENLGPTRWLMEQAPFTAALTVDTDELIRILISPVITRAFWDAYYDEGFFDLSVFIICTFRSGQGYFDQFPNWSSKMMKSGMIQSLAHYLPDQLETEGGRFLADLTWTNDDTGNPVTSISAAAPPSSITCTAVFYEVPGASSSDTVTLRIKEDSPSGNVAAFQSADVGVDPWDYGDTELSVLSVTFDPAVSIGNGATGFFVEIAHGDDAQTLPYFTTDWSVYEQITDIDMTKSAYTLQYSSYGAWPYSLAVSARYPTEARAARRSFSNQPVR